MLDVIFCRLWQTVSTQAMKAFTYTTSAYLTAIFITTFAHSFFLGIMIESSRRCADTRKWGKTTKIKSPRGVAQVLRGGCSTAKKRRHRRVLQESSRRCADTRKRGKTSKIKSPRGALKRYSKARKVPLK